MMDKACKTALRKSLITYLIGKAAGKSRIQSRANGLNLSAFFLYWPNHTMSFEELYGQIEQSCLLKEEKDELKSSFSDIRETWKAQIQDTIQSVAKNFEDEEEASATLSQSDEPLIICGRVIPSDLPKGARLNVDDELARYKKITAAEFASCKS